MKTKLVYGIGINDADYVVQPTVDGKQVWCPYYRAWYGMLTRCYSIKCQQKKPTYVGCEVDPRWHRFMTFRSWMETQDWQDKQLDKDFLGDGKLYSPETCRFIPGWLNKIFNERIATRGELPQGVSRDGNGYAMQASIGGKNVARYHRSVEAARADYITTKTTYVRSKYHLLDDVMIKACERRLASV